MLREATSPPTRTAVALLALLFMSLLACGKIKEKLAEKAAEKAVERATGQKVDLEEGRVQFKDKDGNVAEVGTGTKLPNDWPKALAPYPGSKLLGAYSVHKNKKLDGSISMTTKDTPEQVLAHYTKTLADFRLKSELNLNGMKTKVFEKDGATATISTIPNDEATQANIAVSNF